MSRGDGVGRASRWIRALQARLGTILARARLHRVELRYEPATGVQALAKRRRAISPVLIVLGNLYLRWAGAGVRVLSTRRWHAWERTVYRAAYAAECRVDSCGWLVVPAWPGEVLAGFAADRERPVRDRLRALGAAATGLRGLHRTTVEVEELGQVALSHGDATLRNVVFDPATDRGWWFDFDTIHDLSAPAAGRQADDLRALLYGGIEALADVPVADVRHAVREGYGDGPAWEQLRREVEARGNLHAGVFHMAQAAPSPERCAELDGLLRSMPVPGEK